MPWRDRKREGCRKRGERKVWREGEGERRSEGGTEKGRIQECRKEVRKGTCTCMKREDGG